MVAPLTMDTNKAGLLDSVFAQKDFWLRPFALQAFCERRLIVEMLFSLLA